MRVACVIPVYNGIRSLTALLESFVQQDVKLDLLIVDSGSSDGSAELAKRYAYKFYQIDSSEFNHGATRQFMVDANPEYDLFIFLTQDVYFDSPNALSSLISKFEDASVWAAYGRQLPHTDATLMAQHARLFNYPNKDRFSTLNDIAIRGIKAAFISNSFAAYRRDALNCVGGFPSGVILSEDMFVAAKILIAGGGVFYDANSKCRHSHNYSISTEFSRYFDIGVFHARESWIRDRFGGAGGEGLKYLLSEIKFLGIKNWKLLPACLFRNLFKFLGYKIGMNEKYLPVYLKSHLSMHKNYWKKMDKL